MSDYESAKSGRSTPVAKGTLAEDEDEEDETTAPTTGARVKIVSNRSTDSLDNDAASIAPSTRMSIRSRSSRPGTLQRRLSDLSLGTTFAASAMFGRSASSTRFIGDGDSDAELSDDDAELRAKALAEQDRLRRMNVGDDFFGPSLANMLDKFDRMSYSDTTVNKLSRDTEPTTSLQFASSSAQTTSAAPAATTFAQDDITAEAQKTINEVRQKRADAAADGTESKRRNSADTGIAPSVAAAWLLNQSQAPKTPPIERKVFASTIDPSFTALPPPTSASAAGMASPEQPKVSVLNRPRNRAKRPVEMGGVSISQGRLEADKPINPAEVEDTRSTLPMPLSPQSVKTAGSPTLTAASSQASPRRWHLWWQARTSLRPSSRP